PAAQDGEPRQAGLGAFEEQHLEQLAVVVDGHSPLPVVIVEIQRIAARPGAAPEPPAIGYGPAAGREPIAALGPWGRDGAVPAAAAASPAGDLGAVLAALACRHRLTAPCGGCTCPADPAGGAPGGGTFGVTGAVAGPAG